jgi:hypothetical protein
MHAYRSSSPIRLLSLLLLATSYCSLAPASSFAQPKEAQSASLESLQAQLQHLGTLVQDLQQTVQQQRAELEQLRGQRNVPQAAAAAAAPSTTVQSAPRSLQVGQNAFNPEIGVVADIVAASSESAVDSEGNDKISVRELELVLGADVDPYTRLDTTIAFSDFEDPHLEEGYATYAGVPWLLGKLGRLRPRIGLASPLHRDQLVTVDEPLVVQRYLGVEGLSRTGLELASFVPFSFDSPTLELIAGVMEGGVGEGGELFGETKRQASYYLAARNFWELSEETSLRLGTSWLSGSADDDSGHEVQALGAYATLEHYFSAYQRLSLQAEAYFQERDRGAAVSGAEHDEHFEAHVLRDQDVDQEASFEAESRRHPFGAYALADLRFDSKWSSGLRFDYVEPSAASFEDGVLQRELAYTGYLTFHQSEFARWRLQYQYLEQAEGGDDQRLWLQAVFAIGVHKHQLQ